MGRSWGAESLSLPWVQQMRRHADTLPWTLVNPENSSLPPLECLQHFPRACPHSCLGTRPPLPGRFPGHWLPRPGEGGGDHRPPSYLSCSKILGSVSPTPGWPLWKPIACPCGLRLPETCLGAVALQAPGGPTTACTAPEEHFCAFRSLLITPPRGRVLTDEVKEA